MRRRDAWLALVRALLPVLPLVLAAPVSAESALTARDPGTAPASPPAPAAWRFGLLIDGSWSKHEVDTAAEGLVVIDSTGSLLRLLDESERIDLDGFSGSLSGRLWLPVRALGVRPWLQVGYRYALADLTELGAEVGATVLDEERVFADIRVEYRGGWHAKLGFDVDGSLWDHPLTIGPVLGWERSKYEARLRGVRAWPSTGTPVGSAETREATFDTGTLGLELRTPLVERGRFRMELVVGADYLRSIDGSERLAIRVPYGKEFGTAAGFEYATGEYDVNHAVRASLGVLFSF